MCHSQLQSWKELKTFLHTATKQEMQQTQSTGEWCFISVHTKIEGVLLWHYTRHPRIQHSRAFNHSPSRLTPFMRCLPSVPMWMKYGVGESVKIGPWCRSPALCFSQNASGLSPSSIFHLPCLSRPLHWWSERKGGDGSPSFPPLDLHSYSLSHAHLRTEKRICFNTASCTFPCPLFLSEQPSHWRPHYKET